MLWDLFFSKHGYFVFQQEKQEEQQLKADIESLKLKKQNLQDEVIRLREDPKAIEDKIHQELGYVYPDEIIIITEHDSNQEVKKK